MSPSADFAARRLLKTALHLKALCDHEPGVVPIGMARAKAAVCEAATLFEAELAKPFSAEPFVWSPSLPREASYKPGAAT